MAEIIITLKDNEQTNTIDWNIKTNTMEYDLQANENNDLTSMEPTPAIKLGAMIYDYINSINK